MRKTLRARHATDYWHARWRETEVDTPAEGLDTYPLLHAEMALRRAPAGPVLELGCGLGRLVRCYHRRGLPIIGVDSIQSAICRLKETDPSLDVRHSDARQLSFEDRTFSAVLCFGVYHSLEHDFARAIAETFRVMRPGGILCAEFRAQSIHNLSIDLLKGFGQRRDRFHKWNFRRREAHDLLVEAGFDILSELPAINMPLLYHVRFLRDASQRDYDEHVARAQGYRLRPWVERIHRTALRLAPDAMANQHIFICARPESDPAG